MKKLLALLMALVMITALFAGCGGTTEEAPAEGDAPSEGETAPTEGEAEPLAEGEKYQIAFLLNKTNAPYPAGMLKAINEHLDDWDDVEFNIYDGQADITVQAQQVDEAIAAGSDAIILHPQDSTAAVALTKKIKDAGIYCINVAVPLRDTTYLDAQCGTDIYYGAQLAADAMHEVFPDGANYVTVTCDFVNDNARIRHEEFIRYSEEKGYNFTELAISPDCAWQSEKAKVYMNDMLSKYPGEIDAVYVVDDTIGYGVMQAIDEDTSGLNDDILIFSPSGGIQAVLDAIGSGDSPYYSTIYNGASDEALNAMTVAADMVHGIMPEELFCRVEVYTVTPDNAATFEEPAF